MKEIKKKNKTRNIIAFLGLTLMIVVFPLTSWYYLQQGLNYQKEARAELGDHGKVSPFSFVSNQGRNFTQEDFKGNFSVATFLNIDDEQIKDGYLDLLFKLHDQFDLRPDVLFLTHVSSKFQNGNTLLVDVSKEAKLDDSDQAIFLTADVKLLEKQAKEGYRLPSNNMSFDQNTYMALVDTVGTIINYYNFREEAQMKRLVEHIAMVIPKKIPEKPVKLIEEEK